MTKTEEAAAALLSALEKKGRTLATAESCTGGMIGAALTAIPGSSNVYLGGVISYTNGVKEQLLHVPHETLEAFSAVSPETAQAMAEGVRASIHADLTLSVTGLAGPSGDGSGKSIGLVYVGCATPAGTLVQRHLFSGDRAAIRAQAVDAAIALGSLAVHLF